MAEVALELGLLKDLSFNILLEASDQEVYDLRDTNWEFLPQG